MGNVLTFVGDDNLIDFKNIGSHWEPFEIKYGVNPIWDNYLNGTCNDVRNACCVGALSHGGGNIWRSEVCNKVDYGMRWVSNDPRVHPQDVLDGLTGEVVFLGDSVMHQMYDSMLCFIDPYTKILDSSTPGLSLWYKGTDCNTHWQPQFHTSSELPTTPQKHGHPENM